MRIRTSNPKFAGLVASKMKRMWVDVRQIIPSLRSIGQSFSQHRNSYHTFYQRWGKKPPMSNQEWTLFWGEFRALEGDPDKWYTVITQKADVLAELCDEAMDIVANHERTLDDDLAMFRKSVDRLIVLATEAKKAMETLNGSPDELE